MPTDAEDGTRDPASRFPFLILVAAWASGILYLWTRHEEGISPVTARLDVETIARFGWIAILPGAILLKRLNGSSRGEIAPIPGFALIAAVIGWLAAQILAGLFAPPDSHSLIPALLAQFTAAWILFYSARANGSGTLENLMPRSEIEWKRDTMLAGGTACVLLSVLSLSVLAVNLLSPDLFAGLALESRPISMRSDLFEIIAGVAALPLLEEFIFRAGLIGWLSRRGASPHLAVMISAIIFAAAHLQPELIWARGLGALCMGWLYVRTGRLAASFLLHASANCGILFAARAAQAAGWI